MKIKAGDILIALVAIGLAIALLFSFPVSQGRLTAVVYQDGKEVRRIDLAGLRAPLEFELEGAAHNHIVAENGRIRYAQSDCPDRTCVHTGWLTRAGQSAACLPNRTLIAIEGADDGGLDAISH